MVPRLKSKTSTSRRPWRSISIPRGNRPRSFGSPIPASATPPAGAFSDSELRFLLRIVDETSDRDIPEVLRDWEVDNLAEIVNVNLATLSGEIREFHSGNGRSSLLDEAEQAAGCRILEALEMVNWPIKASLGKSPIEQKIERLKAMLHDQDPASDSFEVAMNLMLELKGQLPGLPDDQRKKYAAEIALAFQAALTAGEEEEEDGEDAPPAQDYHKFDDD
jgi:hypothetical protein